MEEKEPKNRGREADMKSETTEILRGRDSDTQRQAETTSRGKVTDIKKECQSAGTEAEMGRCLRAVAAHWSSHVYETSVSKCAMSPTHASVNML